MRKKKATAREYSWVPGSKWTSLDPNTVGAEIDRLVKVHKQRLAAEDVVAAAANPISPLHSIFEWDDTAAAREYRVEQARRLLRSIQITILTPKGAPITTRLTVATEKPNTPGKRQYSTTEYALSDADLRAEVLRQALRELAAFRRKYIELSELAQVFAVIARTVRKARVAI